ncbi:HalOD1 output domain-containing protein [Halorarum salinum]|uniref:Halobacterial output domain-containing protein n=1 Tax=Halorarum salinum TaxID=2743089 RepID=A0A7D5L9Z4_9EURY|nr:HalOD1 output domain-containing protein [Halobaculum salinum]QLG61447.1 hypothetical protein HUG12_06740 [Halobaculum salinum]
MRRSESNPGAVRPADRSVSVDVAVAVAETLGVDPMDVEQLNDVVDPDALDRLVSRFDGRDDVRMRIEFELAGCSVAVDGRGEIDVAASGSSTGEPVSSGSESTPEPSPLDD